MPKMITGGLVLLALLLVSACGSESSNPSTANVPARESAQDGPTTTATTPRDADSDDDGTPDADDYDPQNAGIQTKTDAQDCDVLGINSDQMREGSCTTDGTNYKVVNRDSTLVLPQMAVRLRSIEAVQSIQREFESPLVGSYVVASVSVTNRLDVPVNVNASDMFGLLVEEKSFNPNFEAMNNGSNPLIYEEIQPDEMVTGKVIFKVAAKRVDGLDKDGNLLALQFSDAEAFGSDEPKKRVGVIRTYR